MEKIVGGRMMNTNVRFYAAFFVDKNSKEPVNYSFYDFLIKLDELMEENVSLIRKNVDGKYIRCFKPKTVGSMKQIVMPIGKRKDSASYTEDENSKSIREIDYDIFDVNHIYYDENKRALIMTNVPSAPRYGIIEEYFNRFLYGKNYELVIRPMYYEEDLRKVRQAHKIKSIIITVDLGNDIDSGFSSSIDQMQLVKAFRTLSQGTKNELNGNRLRLELQLDDRRKNATMDVPNILNLIDCINLESDFIKEIEIKYADTGETRKLSEAKLKEKTRHLEYTFVSTHRMGVEEFRQRGDEAFQHTANKWYDIMKRYGLRTSSALIAPTDLLKEEYSFEKRNEDDFISV